MSRLLPSVLSRFDLPEAELSAARLDGDLVAIGDCFGSVDEIVGSQHRGASLAGLLPPRLIAERRTAAWVLGALDDPPPRHEVCAETGARYRCLGQPRLVTREVVMDDADTVVIGGMRVTTALRTALDIARIGIEATPDEQDVILRLSTIGSFTLADCLHELDRRRHLPDKRRAITRLSAALDQPPLTR